MTRLKGLHEIEKWNQSSGPFSQAQKKADNLMEMPALGFS